MKTMKSDLENCHHKIWPVIDGLYKAFAVGRHPAVLGVMDSKIVLE